MLDALTQALATPGLFWLILTISIAGIVRGFTGFGTALIFVPVANVFLPPNIVIALIATTGVFSTAVLIPRAWMQSARAEVGTLAAAAMLTVPLGLWLMQQLDGPTVRWAVTAVAGGTLLALISGWRFSGHLALPGLIVIGAAAGVIGGLTGITGPIVILFYLAGQSAAQRVRANTILFLAILDVVIIGNLLVQGAITAPVVMLAITLSVPYLVTTLIGQALFDPKFERFYRSAAYGVIGLAVLSGLPIWQGGG